MCWHYGSLALQRICAFGKIVKKCSIGSTPQIELSCTKATCRSQRMSSHAKVTCRGYMELSRARGMRVAQSDLHLQMGGVITVQTLWVKRGCVLVVRLKANKCYQELLCYLSSYINLLNIRLCLGLWPSRKCYWRCNRYHPRVCPDRIAGHIALIASLWPYRWLYRFDRIALIALIALTVSLVVSLIASLWSLWFSCSEVFSAFGIILTICSSNCERPKTEFTALMNHALTFDHPAGPICIHWIGESFRITSRPSFLVLLLLYGWSKRKLMLTSQESGLSRLISRLPHR